VQPSALDTDAPVRLDELLDRGARAALVEGARDLGVSLAIADDLDQILGGERPPGAPKLPVEWDPMVTVAPEGRYVSVGLFNAGDVLGSLTLGPLSDGWEDSAAQAFAIHLRRVADAFLIDGMKRALSARIHMATLEENNRELTEKNKRLNEMVDKLQEADRVKSNFLATVSHELRTPLTSVIGYSEMLLEGIAGPLNDEQRDYVRTVMEKGDQLLQLITGILDISRMEAGEMKVRKAPFELSEVVAVAVSTVAPNARRKRIHLEAEDAAGLPRAFGDRDKTRQVILNLLGNAVKFTPEAGTVRLTAQRAPVRRGEPESPPGIRVSIADNGIGIPAEAFGRVFDPFYQVDNSSTREYGGTGLGLSIVKRLLREARGAILIQSAPGAGARFTVCLQTQS
jgi:signal transduction histidine kinase